MKANLTSATRHSLNHETGLGWLNMPEFGSGLLEYLSRDLSDAEFEPAAALSDEANEFLAALPLEQESPTPSGWHEVSSRMHSLLHQSFWSAISSAIELREGDRVAA